MSVSVVIPIYNERDNISRLYWELQKVLPVLERTYEILFVDDGSTDGSGETLRDVAATDARVRVVQFRRNYGQTAALQAGIDMATGDVIVTMDGDLQNDPSDIPMMLKKLDEGYDLVHGWRKTRQDALVHRKIPSRIANWLISKVTRFPVHDLGCTLKAMRRDIAQEIELYGEMHRFIPILAHQRGAKCAEVATKHHPRTAGKTKYGIDRTFRVLLDLVTVKYMLDYFAHPMKLFGGVGLACFAAGFFAALLTLVMKLFGGIDMTGNPFMLLSLVSGLAGIQFLSLGLLGEVAARIYYGSQRKQHYTVRRRFNFADDAAPPATIKRVA